MTRRRNGTLTTSEVCDGSLSVGLAGETVLGRFQLGPGGEFAVLQVTPQGHLLRLGLGDDVAYTLRGQQRRPIAPVADVLALRPELRPAA